MKNITDSVNIAASESIETEGFIRHSEEKYRNILATIEEGYFETDLRGNFTFFNDALCKIIGYDKDEAQGMSYRHYVDSETGKKLFENLVKIYETGQPVSQLDWEIVRKNKTKRFVESSMSLMRDALQKPTGFRGLVRDVTERKQAETDFQESETRYRLLFESNPNATWVWDAATLDFLAVNEEAIRLFGYSRKEFQKMTIKDLQPHEDPTIFSEYIAQTNAGIEKFKSVQIQKKDGTIIEAEITLKTINFAGRRAKLTLINDITEMKRAELESQLIYEIIQGIATTSNLDEFLKHIHQSLKKVLYAENCFVALHDKATDLINYEFWVDKFDPVPAPRPVNFGFGSYVLRTGTPLLLTDEIENELYESGEVEKSGTKAASWLGVPLRTHSNPIGVLVIQHYENENAYSQRDLELLKSVGDHISLAIERKLAESALAAAARRESVMIENALGVICTIDAEGFFRSINPACFRMWGYQPEELIGCQFMDFVTPEDVAKTIAVFADILAGDEATDFENRYVHKNGTLVDVRWTSYWSESEQMTFAVAHDITERKRAEEAVQDSHDYLNRIINAVADPIFVMNRQHQLTLINDAFCQFTGRSREEVIGKTSHELFSAKEADVFWEKDEQVFTSGKENINEEEFTDLHGNKHIIVTRKRLHIDKNGEQFLVGVSRDITEDKQIEKVLIDSEIMQRQLAEQQSAILDALPAHICLLDKDGNILEVNNEWKRFAVGNGYRGNNFGVSSNYLKTCENATGDCAEGARQAAEICRDVLSGKSFYQEMEYPCHSPTEERWFILQVNALQGAEGGAVLSHYNITTRKKAEILLKNSEEFNRSIFEHSPDCVKILELDGKLHSMNNNGLCIMEIDNVSEFIGKNWVDFWEGEEHKLAIQAVEDAQNGKERHYEGFCKTAKGTLKYWDVLVNTFAKR